MLWKSLDTVLFGTYLTNVISTFQSQAATQEHIAFFESCFLLVSKAVEYRKRQHWLDKFSGRCFDQWESKLRSFMLSEQSSFQQQQQQQQQVIANSQILLVKSDKEKDSDAFNDNERADLDEQDYFSVNQALQNERAEKTIYQQLKLFVSDTSLLTNEKSIFLLLFLLFYFLLSWE